MTQARLDASLAALTGPTALQCEANPVSRIGRSLARCPLPLPARDEFAVLLSIAPSSFELPIAPSPCSSCRF